MSDATTLVEMLQKCVHLGEATIERITTPLMESLGAVVRCDYRAPFTDITVTFWFDVNGNLVHMGAFHD